VIIFEVRVLGGTDEGEKFVAGRILIDFESSVSTARLYTTLLGIGEFMVVKD
jgi:hypothetical protein